MSSSPYTVSSGRSPYGERGLKYHGARRDLHVLGRSPYGERGLKYVGRDEGDRVRQSLSLRRAWIEMLGGATRKAARSRSPYGERGLKFKTIKPIFAKHVALLTESVD